MPQMAPLMWLNLMIMFLQVFVAFYGFTYFLKVPEAGRLGYGPRSSQEKIWRW